MFQGMLGRRCEDSKRIVRIVTRNKTESQHKNAQEMESMVASLSTFFFHGTSGMPGTAASPLKGCGLGDRDRGARTGGKLRRCAPETPGSSGSSLGVSFNFQGSDLNKAG